MMNSYFFKDISYGKHERNTIDIHIPYQVCSRSDTHGVLLFIHGGGWHQGDKTDYENECTRYLMRGHICASLNYRYVSDNTTIFDELDDIASALETVKLKCAERGYKIDKCILTGASAGAHLALMYAYTSKNKLTVRPVAVCAYCPPVDFSNPNFLMGISGEFEEWKYNILSKCCGVKITKETFGNRVQQDALLKISPISYLTPDCVPTFVFQGKKDELVPYEDACSFIQKLTELNVRNDFVVFENSGHTLDNDQYCTELSRSIIYELCDEIL